VLVGVADFLVRWQGWERRRARKPRPGWIRWPRVATPG